MGLLARIAEARKEVVSRRFDPLALEWEMSPIFGVGRAADGRERPVMADFRIGSEWILKRNGPIASLIFIRLMAFSEARFQFRKMRNGRPGDLFGTQDLEILERPWANATTGDLLARMIMDVDLAGNAFFTTITDPGGGQRIKRLRPDWVTIVTGSHDEPDLYGDAIDGDIIGYIYDPMTGGDGQGQVLLPHQVAHFAPIPDPEYQFRGMSWLTPVIREIEADTAATQHKLNFFRNGATLQTVVSVDPSVTPEKFALFKAKMEESHAGVHNAYKTLYLGGGADAKVVGADLRQLDFKATQGAGESRLAAAAGVPSVIVGFSEGLQGSSLNAGNYASSRRRFADLTLRPLWRNAAGSLATLVNVPGDAELWFDDRDIAFLREDRGDVADIQNKQANTILQLVNAGYEPATAVAAVQAEDFSLLKHTGLYSVQLQKPGEQGEPPAAGQPATASQADGEQAGQGGQ